jgi:hypothetical protein
LEYGGHPDCTRSYLYDIPGYYQKSLTPYITIIELTQQHHVKMDNLSKSDNQHYYDLLKTEYIKLLSDKDVLLQWGKPQLEALYNTRVGYLQIEKLRSQLYIRALKRKIELVWSAINQNKSFNINEIELQVSSELAEAEFNIMNEVNKLENSKYLLSHLESPERSTELRKLYKHYAKRLHPDVNDNLTTEQINLWYLVKDAYENGDLEKLKALKLAYAKELEASENKINEFTEEDLSLKIEVLAEGIRVLNDQLVTIKGEFPFNVESQIKDEEWVRNKQEELKTELGTLQKYETELMLEYHKIIGVL